MGTVSGLCRTNSTSLVSFDSRHTEAHWSVCFGPFRPGRGPLYRDNYLGKRLLSVTRPMNANQMSPIHSDAQTLEGLRRNATKTITIIPEWDEPVMREVCHLLYQNSSVTGIHFNGTVPVDEDSKHSWIPLLALFPTLSLRITHLTVSRNIPFVVLPTMVWHFRQLTALTLEGTVGLDWSPAEWQSFAASLESHPHLKSFEFRQYAVASLSDRRCPASNNNNRVAVALATAPRLAAYRQEGSTGTSKDEGGVQLSPDGLASLLSSRSLQHLRYAGLGFSTYGMDEPAISSAWMHVSKKLTSSSVKTLVLPNNFLTPEALSWIVQGIENVVKLDLSHNKIGSPKVVEALICKESLQFLDLSFCGLSEVSLLRIARCLPANRSLRRLDLAGNWKPGYGLPATAAFAQAMQNLRMLELVLDLDWATAQFDGGGGGVVVVEIDTACQIIEALVLHNTNPVDAVGSA